MSKKENEKPKIGFIGQGFIGKNMADDFENRGFSVVRYALEEQYVNNEAQIATCDIVFVAVPTPTTKEGFSDKALRAVLPLVGKGSTVVIKSTILPGKTEELQALFPDILVLHSPEFLAEKTAVEDTQKPQRNIVGIPKDTEAYKEAGKEVLRVLPKAPFELLCSAREAELIKYAGNCYLASRVVFMNALYDIAEAEGLEYDVIAHAMSADKRIGGSHMNIIDRSGHEGSKPGRGAGGHCFPKDLAALRMHAEGVLGTDTPSVKLLRTLEDINLTLLCNSEKDLDLLSEIYHQSTLGLYTNVSKKEQNKAKKKVKKN